MHVANLIQVYPEQIPLRHEDEVEQNEFELTGPVVKVGRTGMLDLLVGTPSHAPKTNVVISQTHWLVSQERLSPRAGTSVFVDLHPNTPSGERWF